MDFLLGFLSGEFSKVAVFLLLFATVAIVFEIFYFRRRREHETVAQSSQAATEFITKPPRLRKKTVFIILGVLLLVVLLPASVFVVFQQVNVQKQAQISTPPPQAEPTIACDQIDIVRARVVVTESSLAMGDTISFIGYCYVTGAGQSISKLRFALTTPSGAASPVEYIAFSAPSKNGENRQYFQATYPNVRLSQGGTYKLDVWGFTSQTVQTKQPFSKSFAISSSVVSRITSTPTVTQEETTQGNKAPTCSSLSAIPLIGPAPLTVSLTGTGSDSDGQVVASEFTYGDGTKETVNKVGSATSSHVYQAAGSYTASLRVQDNDRAFSAASSLCRVIINVSTGSSATTSAQLKAQPTRGTTPTPTKIALPQAGVGLPMVGFVTGGLIMLTLGLLLAF